MKDRLLQAYVRSISLLASLASLLVMPADSHGGAWTLPKGQLWSKVTIFHQNTNDQYLANHRFQDGDRFEPGDRLEYPFGGEFDARAVYLDAEYGVTDRLDLGIQIPYQDRAYSDTTRKDSPAERGIGDIKVSAKLRVLKEPAVLTVKLAVKMPTGKNTDEDGLIEDGVIPVGDGQADYEFIGQVGRSLWPLPAYGNLDLGYRVRTLNKSQRRDPGDEWFINAEIGYQPTQRLLLMLKYDRTRSDPSTDFAFLRNESQIKHITYLSPTVSYLLGKCLAVEASVWFAQSGRNFPAGHQLALGLSTQLDLLGKFGKTRSN